MARDRPARKNKAAKETARQGQAPPAQASQPSAIQDGTSDADVRRQASGPAPSVPEAAAPPRPGTQPPGICSPDTGTGKHGDGPPQGAESRPSLWRAFLDKINHAPFPINLLGPVLERLPLLWLKCALVVVFVVVGVPVVRALVGPVRDIGDWVHSWLVPGPPVAVSFTNETGQPVTIDADFKYWTLLNEADRLDDSKARLARIADGPVDVNEGGSRLVHLHLKRGPATWGVYRSGCWLALRFTGGGIMPTIEARKPWSQEINKALSVSVYDPNWWSSPPIQIYLSAKDHKIDPKHYISQDSGRAVKAIADKLGVFQQLAVPKASTITIAVGCYRTDKPNIGNMCVRVENSRIKEPDLAPQEYETSENLEAVTEALHDRAWRIAYFLRERAWEAYPVQGKVREVEREKENGGRPTLVLLDIGRHAGVFKRHPDDPVAPRDQIFGVYRPSDHINVVAYVRVTEVSDTESYAEPMEPIERLRIEERWHVRRHTGRTD